MSDPFAHFPQVRGTQVAGWKTSGERGEAVHGSWRPGLIGRPAVYEFHLIHTQTIEPHKKPQTRMRLTWGQMGVICPVLVAAW